jgi:hypothetical protein
LLFPIITVSIVVTVPALQLPITIPFPVPQLVLQVPKVIFSVPTLIFLRPKITVLADVVQDELPITTVFNPVEHAVAPITTEPAVVAVAPTAVETKELVWTTVIGDAADAAAMVISVPSEFRACRALSVPA